MALTIGKYIHFALSQNADLVELTNGNIFPVVCPDVDNTPTPYIIYWIDGLKEESTKDGIYGDTATVKIMVVAKDYEDKMDILPLVRQAMAEGMEDWNNQAEKLSGTVAEFEVSDQTMELEGDLYDYEQDLHLSTMSYEIETD